MSELHWDGVYVGKRPDEVSWYQPVPETSLRLISEAVPSGCVVDVGAGASTLADHLVERGYAVTVLDVAPSAIATVRARLGDAASYVVGDLLAWRPGTTYDVWHDRAVFHFLTEHSQQASYAALAARVVRPGGALVVGTFALDGPTSCSGLPTARWNAEGLAKVFAAAFDLIANEDEEHPTPWDAVQSFTWVTLRRRP